MATYISELKYIESAASLEAKIVKIDQIIDGLMNSAMENVGNSDLKDYFLDDGQTKIRANYRSSSEILDAVADWEKIKTVYVNRLNGRTFRLRSRTHASRRY
jgi:hypothetical protein